MLAVQGVTCSFGTLTVLKGIDLEVQRGEIMCLLGPSGCGKTTLLRVIAGLERPDSGDVRLDGRSVLGLPIHARDFGLMFQDFALFPHMNVAQNVTFGLRMRGVSYREQERRTHEVLELVGLTGFERRDVSQLSGGERQRVALARSLAPNPRLLMLDEPVGSLDAALRERLVVELREIIKRIGQTALYVTHDQHEAFAIADRIAIMNAGKIEQIGAPEQLYRQPETQFVARFLGLNNVVPVLSRNERGVTTAVGEFQVDGQPSAVLLHPDGIRPVSPDTPGAITGRVRERVFMGDAYRLEVALENAISLTIKIPSSEDSPPQEGKLISLAISPEMILPLVR